MSNRIERLVAIALATALLLSACAKQPNGETPSSSGADVAAKPTTAQTFTTVDLAAGEIAVEGAAYYLPLGEGKYVPADAPVWREYLDGQTFSALESFSMPFVAVDHGDSALVYVMENPYRATVHFTGDTALRLTLVGNPSSLAPLEANTVRVYTTENNAAAVAGAYKSYVEETRVVLTLADKEAANPNVAKLYGAPHVYLWGDFLLSEADVKWQKLIAAADSPVLAQVSRLLADSEDGSAFTEVLREVSGQDYVNGYQRGVLLRGLSGALTRADFYDSAVFAKRNDTMNALLAKDPATLHPSERILLHKHALYENLPGVFAPVDEWYADATVDLLNEMKAEGIDTAWIGLASDGQANRQPKLVETAAGLGYLVGPYDSYHSIHEPGNEQWETAKFPDPSLYDNATVENEQGEKRSGFQNVGRKLNPTLAMPSVRERMAEAMRTGLPFHSWFVDCDATGEVYDDYSAAHPTTKQQDVAARLERLDFIAQEYGLVVGSEGGNDFAANSIAFAHGIELPAFSWMDDDMSHNKESEYYLGRYYSPDGGVAEKFANSAPLKEKFRELFLDMSYQIPLFKLVYNDSVITSYQWEWSTLKIAGEVENRMLRELLYNVPPMYHLDRPQWDANRDTIAAHHAVWSAFAKKAVTREMTAFAWLTDDRLVQSTAYGEDLQAVANFSDAPFTHGKTELPPHSVLLIDGASSQIYTP